MNTNFTSRLLCGIVLLLTSSLTAEAAFLSPQQSLSRAESTGTIRKMPGNSSFTLAHTEKADGQNFLYVFN
ncbi:MAG: hypothetical protein K2K93_08855, partial [Muribaculaceae bacterium]|nr:hypothetical protein [Muribaculaceae bacterium]